MCLLFGVGGRAAAVQCRPAFNSVWHVLVGGNMTWLAFRLGAGTCSVRGQGQARCGSLSCDTVLTGAPATAIIHHHRSIIGWALRPAEIRRLNKCSSGSGTRHERDPGRRGPGRFSIRRRMHPHDTPTFPPAASPARLHQQQRQQQAGRQQRACRLVGRRCRPRHVVHMAWTLRPACAVRSRCPCTRFLHRIPPCPCTRW